MARSAVALFRQVNDGLGLALFEKLLLPVLVTPIVGVIDEAITQQDYVIADAWEGEHTK
jgi:hypothetical protein